MAAQSEGSRLSPQQRRLWSLQNGEVPFRSQCAVLIGGPLRREHLQRAAAAVTERHEILRTTFRRRAGMRIPLQVPNGVGSLHWTEMDLGGLSPEELDARVECLFREDRGQAVDLGVGPLGRWVLAAAGPERHILFFGLPALCADVNSLDTIVGDLVAHYSGGAALLEAEPLQYADFAEWSAQLLLEESEEAAQAKAFWDKADPGAAGPLALPGEAGKTGDGLAAESVEVELEPGLRSRILLAARDAGVPLADYAFAAWAVLLGRLTGREDLLVGRVFSGRGYEDLQGAVGLFSRCLPVPLHLRPGTSFEALLEQTAGRVRQASEWEEYGLRQEEEGAGGEPRFPVLFEAFAPPGEHRADTVHFQVLDRRTDLERCKWSLRLRETRGSFSLHLAYDPALFGPEEVRGAAERLRHLLETVAADPRVPVGEIEIVTPAERRALAAELQGPRHDTEPRASVLTRFAAWVGRAPGRPAVVFEDQCLSYAELDERAGRLARHLLRLGLAPEDRVALRLERSVDVVVAMLGVLKAGGAYVPLDPDLPQRRLERMLAVASPALVLTSESLAGLEAGPDSEERASAGAAAPLEDAMAYLIFTSGSTGQPKGVAVTHRNLLNYTEGILRVLAVPSGACFATVSTFAADLGYTAVFPSLCSGGTLHVISHARAADPSALAEYLDRHPVDVLKIVPAHMEALLAVEPARVLPRHRLVLGGEALRWPLARRLLTTEGAPVVINHYGPTETTVGILTHRLDGQEEAAGASVPVGRPLANSRALLLDGRLRAVPAGVLGEIFLGGLGVARGYFGDPAATAERFVPDPYAPSPGERLYRTGDLGRFRTPDGIEFAGRKDHQVKIRGFRIELGEIEHCLVEHPALLEAVAVLREDRPGERRIVAYVVARPGERPAAAELREFLKERIPEPMIPAAFLRLDRLPLTPNGKADRGALPPPDQRPLEAEPSFTGPRTPNEEILAGIWQEVLGVPRVGVHDNFFELGGDSILVIQIVARANRHGLRYSPRQFFQHQTVAELAAAGAAAAPRSGPAHSAPAAEIPLTPIQRWFFEQEFPEPHHWNQALLLEAREDLDPALLGALLGFAAAPHDAFRLRFQRTADGWAQRCGEPGSVPFAVLDLAALPAGERRQAMAAAAAATQGSLDLGAGPLLRGVLFRLGEGTADRLLLVAHHLVMDAVSWRILIEDLTSAYRQVQRGEAPELAPATTSFAQWAERLLDHARGGLPAGEVARWREEGGPFEPLPVDLAAGENVFASREGVSRIFDADLTRRLLQVAPAAYRTQINDLLLTALARAFARWTGRPSLWIEAEGHGREDLFADVDLSRTMGWFTAHYPVFLDLGSATDPGECLKTIKERLRWVPANKAGYGLLRYLQDDEALAARLRARPEPQVTFNYLGQVRGVTSEGSLFATAPEHHGPTRGGAGKRRALVEVVAVVGEERLRVTFRYSRNLHRSATIERLADGFCEDLRSLVDHCCSVEGGFTPSDFPLARLSQDQLERIARRMGGAGRIEDIYPLAPLQEGLLFHSRAAQMAGEPDEYFRQYVSRIQGRLDAGAFARVWQESVDRHPILRTAFLWDEVEAPCQIVLRHAGLPFEVVDLRSCSSGQQERRIAAFLAEDRGLGFDLTTAPLLRIRLFRLAEDVYRMVWSYHHLLLDGWSIALMFAEASSRYQTGKQPRQGRPFRDYIAWLAEQEPGQAEAFWRHLLRGYSEPVRISVPPPASGPEAGGKALPTESAAGELSEGESAALERLARSSRLTLNTLVQGAWGLLLGFYTGARDVVFGATVSGRPTDLAGFEKMLGMFINTLPVRAEIDPREPFLAYLERLHRQLVEARQHEHTPLFQIHRWSEVPRGLPLFETIVIFENYRFEPGRGGEGKRPGVTLEESQTLGGTNYPIAVIVKPGRRLKLRLIYDPRRFDPATVARMLAHFQRILTELAERPGEPVGLVSPLSAGERAQILETWNGTAEETGGRASLLHRRFARQAALTPDRNAVEGGGERLTYRELDRRSAALARSLRRAGAGLETRVAVLLERSAGMAVALLGILRAGGAYVPLDPSHPRERLELILEDAAPAVLLTQEALAGGLPATRARVIHLEEAVREEAGDPAPDDVEPEHLAYVIFTSGSTGRPKGVQIPHGALANLLASMGRRLPLAPDDVLLAVTTLAFDIAALEIFLPLVSGACTVLAGDEARDPARLAASLEESGATVMQATPSTWQMLVDSGWSGGGRLRMLCGGEALGRDLADRLLERGAELWNVYGPTETTIWSTCHRLGHGSGAVPIGRPLGNTEVFLLDPWLRCLPVGVPGGLYIGGHGLARGYHDRPGLTAGAFVPHPFATRPGERLYRTGDQARWLPDGVLEFLGRDDFQVKVRGFRIELGEIEHALAGHPGVRQAVVVAREAAPGHRQLVAYLVAEAQPAPSSGELRELLRVLLPDYMVPARFVFLDAMPLSPSGKLDRKALPAPDQPASGADGYVGPRNAIEEKMAAVWSEMLGAERVGVHDNFFDLGGDSILTIRILARLYQLGIRLTPLQVFDLQTVARLAAVAVVEGGAGAAVDRSPAGDSGIELDPDDLADVLSKLGGFSE